MKNQIDIDYFRLKLEAILKEVLVRFQMNPKDRSLISITPSDETNKLLFEAPWFMISVNPTSPNIQKFIILFRVKTQSSLIAETVRLIGNFLLYEEYAIGSEYYFNEKGQLFVGNDALNIHEEEVMGDQGKVRCGICERFYFINKINESGVCLWCEAVTKDNTFWS